MLKIEKVRLIEAMQTLDPWEFLNVKKTGNKDDDLKKLRNRYSELVKKYHPDKTGSKDDRYMKMIAAAYAAAKSGKDTFTADMPPEWSFTVRDSDSSTVVPVSASVPATTSGSGSGSGTGESSGRSEGTDASSDRYTWLCEKYNDVDSDVPDPERKRIYKATIVANLLLECTKKDGELSNLMKHWFGFLFPGEGVLTEGVFSDIKGAFSKVKIDNDKDSSGVGLHYNNDRANKLWLHVPKNILDAANVMGDNLNFENIIPANIFVKALAFENSGDSDIRGFFPGLPRKKYLLEGIDSSKPDAEANFLLLYQSYQMFASRGGSNCFINAIKNGRLLINTNGFYGLNPAVKLSYVKEEFAVWDKYDFPTGDSECDKVGDIVNSLFYDERTRSFYKNNKFDNGENLRKFQKNNYAGLNRAGSSIYDGTTSRSGRSSGRFVPRYDPRRWDEIARNLRRETGITHTGEEWYAIYKVFAEMTR